MESCEIACFDFNEMRMLLKSGAGSAVRGRSVRSEFRKVQSENLISGIWKARNQRQFCFLGGTDCTVAIYW